MSFTFEVIEVKVQQLENLTHFCKKICLVIRSPCTQCHIDQLEMTQRKAARFAFMTFIDTPVDLLFETNLIGHISLHYAAISNP